MGSIYLLSPKIPLSFRPPVQLVPRPVILGLGMGTTAIQTKSADTNIMLKSSSYMPPDLVIRISTMEGARVLPCLQKGLGTVESDVV